MEIIYTVKYHYLVREKDIPRLDSDSKKRIKSAIEEKLTTHPESFGIPLRASLAGYRKLRVGDYRVVFKIKECVVFILIIEHRSVAYQEIYKRL